MNNFYTVFSSVVYGNSCNVLTQCCSKLIKYKYFSGGACWEWT